MKYKLIKFSIGIILVIITLFLYPIGKLIFTDARITKSLFIEQYYAKISSEEYDFNVFRYYMKSNGWIENESRRLGGLHVFEKSGETKEILNTNVKTIIVDGKFNIKYFQKNRKTP